MKCSVRLGSELEYYQLIPLFNFTPLLPIFPPALRLHLPSSLYVSHPVVTPSPPPALFLPCHSTLLNCSSNGKDGSVEMERIEKRREGNQWDNRQGRGPEQRGWPQRWSVETTHTHPYYSMYITHNHRSLHTLTIQESLSRLVCVWGGCTCEAAVCVGLPAGGGAVQGLWR